MVLVKLLRRVFLCLQKQTVLYVDRQGASFPIGCMLPRIIRLSCEQREVGVKQIVEQPARIEYTVGRTNAIINEYTIFLYGKISVQMKKSVLLGTDFLLYSLELLILT